MGRGLSLVQKRILTFVLQEKFVTCQDLLTMWGVQPGAIVDKAKYASAHSGLSRSLSRLYWRGLIEYWQDKLSHYRTAITLTEVGRSMAESIILEEGENG
jgi:DNA-binding MarR family transcriptional regulator